jgi:DNA-binding XRE family transcriptional regulator
MWPRKAASPSPTVSAIENGKATARIGLVLQICRNLGLRLTVSG